jgi:hypothetical protein
MEYVIVISTDKEDSERKSFVVFALSSQMNKNILSAVKDALVSS